MRWSRLVPDYLTGSKTPTHQEIVLSVGACKGGLLWGPADGPPLTACAVADVKAVKEKNAAQLEGPSHRRSMGQVRLLSSKPTG